MFRRLIRAAFISLAVVLGLTAVFSIPVRASDETRGKILFLRCASCHDISNAASAKVGPNLRHIFERQVASLQDYPYSAALRSQDFRWDSIHLDAWLTNPNSVAPGTTMAFAGLPDSADRQAVIAFLRQQGEQESR
jgi:cytochrome c